MDLHSATKTLTEVEQRLVDAIAAMGDFPGTAGKGYCELGEIRRRKGDADGARQAFKQAREHNKDPQPGEALLRCQLGEADAAATDLRMRMDAEQDEINRLRLLPAAVEIALARGKVDEADRYCTELEAGAEKKFDSPGFRAWGGAMPAAPSWLSKATTPKRSPFCKTPCAATARPSAATKWPRYTSGCHWHTRAVAMLKQQKLIPPMPKPSTNSSALPPSQASTPSTRRPDQARARGAGRHRRRRLQP